VLAGAAAAVCATAEVPAKAAKIEVKRIGFAKNVIVSSIKKS
jgi:hypothetical protein